MKRNFTLVVVLSLMAAFVLFPSAALARADFTEYTGIETAIAPPEGFTCRAGGPVMHCSQTSFWHDETTDPRTTGDTTVQANLKTKDFMNAHIWGTFVTEVAAYDATWVGTWTGKLVNGAPIFKAVGHGTGALEGLQLKATFEGAEEGIMITGRILDPHGA